MSSIRMEESITDSQNQFKYALTFVADAIYQYKS